MQAILKFYISMKNIIFYQVISKQNTFNFNKKILWNILLFLKYYKDLKCRILIGLIKDIRKNKSYYKKIVFSKSLIFTLTSELL
jgi:hypothetical protein